ncbi:hypothetical protein ARMGADRAFT_246938 [Armillaria gallica]|uniref:Uncharacterized protein n=1 Tax=Armillaria gallica TaxID=47427 RepID=A0A2H3EHB3_ARMGA|nr:hypothetical protein ARMGADRAFT_246938 [Armillaria gallica]
MLVANTQFFWRSSRPTIISFSLVATGIYLVHHFGKGGLDSTFQQRFTCQKEGRGLWSMIRIHPFLNVYRHEIDEG